MKNLPISVYRTSCMHKCPACGKGNIYSSLLSVADNCSYCGLTLREHDAGDGPAFFAMFIIGILVTLLAVLVDMFFEISLWLHLVIWTPLIVFLSIYLLKVMKSFLIAMEYRHNILGYRNKGKK